MASFPQTLLLAAPRGYCAGVDRAVQTVERALGLYGAPVYVRKEIVHNKHVVEQLRDRGAGGRPGRVLCARRGAERPCHRPGPSAEDDRRDLSARNQGPPGGGEVR